MKTQSIVLLLFLTVMIPLSCCKVDMSSSIVDSNENTGVYTVSSKRTLDEATKIALKSYSDFKGISTKSSNEEVAIEKIDCITIGQIDNSTDVDTLMYVVDFTNGNGFAVVSANKATEDLIAITDRGSYDDSSTGDNESFKMFMEMASNYIVTSSSPLLAGDDLRSCLKYESEQTVLEVEPLLSIEWGQGSIYGKYASNGTSGCANTAMAQIMTYFKYPNTLDITYDGANLSSQTLDWEKMIKHKNYLQTCNLEEEDHEAISQLMRQLGELNASTYRASGSTGTPLKNTISTFKKLGYTVSDSYISYNSQNLYSILSSDSLLLFYGACTDALGNTEGHSFVVDGAKNITNHYMTWISYDEGLTWILQEDVYSYLKYLHINWGWDGDCNGYFSAGVFNTAKGYNYDSSYHSTSYDFDMDIEYITVKL